MSDTIPDAEAVQSAIDRTKACSHEEVWQIREDAELLADACEHYQQDLAELRAERDLLKEKLHESIEYDETTDALLDGIIPTRENSKDPTSKQLWLKDRVELLIEQNESSADKLSDCWLLLDEIASGNVPCMASVRAACQKLLREQNCPAWREQN